MSLASYQLLHPAIKKRRFFNRHRYYNSTARRVKGKNKIFLEFFKFRKNDARRRKNVGVAAGVRV